MGTVYLKDAAAPDATYTSLGGAIMSHAQMDNNLQLFLRNDVDDTFNGTLTITGGIIAASINTSALGTGTASATTFLRGDRTWAPADPVGYSEYKTIALLGL